MTDILSRYGKFCKGLRTSVSPEIRVLFNLAARDLQSTTAKNIRFVQEQSRTDPWTVSPGTLKQELHSASLVVVPVQEEWKLRYLGILLTQLVEAKGHVQEDRVQVLQELIDNLVR